MRIMTTMRRLGYKLNVELHSKRASVLTDEEKGYIRVLGRRLKHRIEKLRVLAEVVSLRREMLRTMTPPTAPTSKREKASADQYVLEAIQGKIYAAIVEFEAFEPLILRAASHHH